MAPEVDLDRRGAMEGWDATASQQMERLLRETGAPAGLILGGVAREREQARPRPVIRLVSAPRGETSGWMDFPLKGLTETAGRPMLGGLKLLLGRSALHTGAPEHRLPALLKESRESQANVSTALAGQVLAALHSLLRGFTAAAPTLTARLAREDPHHLYEGLLTVLLRLVFLLYAEDRDLLPAQRSGPGLALYEANYSVRGLLAKLEDDEARYPATMDDRRGAWGRLLALFRLVHSGDAHGWIQPRGGKLFDPDSFPFLEARQSRDSPPQVARVSDACVLEVLRNLMRLGGERLSYRTLDVEEIGSVYQTVMGFTVEVAKGPSIAIRAGKHDRTPVFVNLETLAAIAPKERIKHLKETTDRGKFPTGVEPALVAATTPEALAAAFESSARGGVIDERASPARRIVQAGTAILQPTDERRRTGSHYTPRSLTEPIVRHALEPIFARLGPDATPAQILDLKVCDPAVGSGAFLVEVCRQLGVRLEAAWKRWEDERPQIEDDAAEGYALAARRLVAQRCLYGVDRNPLACDLARLSLWLATLARDHEFTFLDHAIKTGESLVGLTNEQIADLTWESGSGQAELAGVIVRSRLAQAEAAREEIRDAPDYFKLSDLQRTNDRAEAAIRDVRVLGDAVLAAFFGGESTRSRRLALGRVWEAAEAARDMRDALRPMAAELSTGPRPLRPFHWQLEFPEVFDRERPGFDIFVGNPPFAGKNTIIGGAREYYLPWLQTLHEGAHGNSDLVAHFFRRAFALLRDGGVLGLIATNTLGQGDTRASGLAWILGRGGAIGRARRRLKWPGEAAVVVSVVHIVKGPPRQPILDERPVRRISAYLVEGDLDGSPAPLAANDGKAFVGSYLLGMGFTFDDEAAARGKAESLAHMRNLIADNPRNRERVFPYIGGEEVNTSPTHAHDRYVIDFADFPLRRDPTLSSWFLNESLESRAERRRDWLRGGVVPGDYPAPVAEDWPDLLSIVQARVKPERLRQKDKIGRAIWWRFLRRRDFLYSAIKKVRPVYVTTRVSPHLIIAALPSDMIYSEQLIVFALEREFPILQSRPHELWARFFASTLEDRLRYTPSDCFRTFPRPVDQKLELLAEGGARYLAHRADVLVARDEGLTSTYNRFHNRNERAEDIERLRELHCQMDDAVLRAYGWDDLADRASPQFIEQEADEGKTPKTRLDWPAEFKDAVLARLLELNASRPHATRGAARDADDDEDDGEMGAGGVAEADPPTFDNGPLFDGA
ncbi:MAG TPA: DNA methyltransferase [Caulobacteraceae bacterium]|nr:DNA methyltransferase [Caulobacteraceae bacterium]